ncbi:MAG: DUF2341 domain-containing protein [Candidatus Aenigmatarchaeota archaeon]
MNNFNLISAYIATIIILIITIGIGAVLYLYFSGYISQLTSETEEATTIKSIIECSQARIDGYAYRITLKDFNYRIPINITERSGNDLIDYQVLITLDTASLISQGKMRNDCGDIRFTDSDGSTLLNYWVESGCNSANTRIWVKVPNIPANSNKTIYLYYGNSEATSLSNVKDVFIREIDGLVLHLTFDEGEGTIAYDSSGNNNHGTLINGPTWVDGVYGNALSFDGVDDFVQINDSPTLNPTNDGFTISFWINLNRYVNPGAIIAKRVDPNNGYFVFIWSGGYMFFDWGGYTGANRWNTSFVPELNRWYFIVLIQNSSGRFLYVDGDLFSFTTNKGNTALASTNASLRIFADSVSARYFNDGMMDEVRFYSRDLTPEEILDLYNNYGYSTPNYPGKTLVRKYVSPEPTVSLGNEETSPIIKLNMINLGIELGKRYLIKLIYEDGKIIVRNITLDKNLSSGESKEIYLTDLPKGIIRKIEIYSIDVCPNMLVGIRSVNIEV